MKEADFVHSGDKNSYRIDLSKVESYERGVTSYPTGFFGLGKMVWEYLIIFYTSSGSFRWKFNSETEREKVFKRLELRTISKAL
jgi:hypothetical protein